MEREVPDWAQLVYALTAEARKYDDAIVLGRGDPDLDTPAHVISAAHLAMKENATEIAPPSGLYQLRVAIADRVRLVNGIHVDPATDVVITNGGQEAVFIMTLAALKEGDQILVPQPTYGTYAAAIRFCGATLVGIPTHSSDGYRVDPNHLLGSLGPKTRALLHISPHNPTAHVATKDEIDAIVDLADNNDLTILSDEIYDMITFAGVEHNSPAAHPRGASRTMTLNALSKSHAMTGWRVGWIVGPSHLMRRVEALKAALTGATSVIVQYAALAALTDSGQATQLMRQEYERRRDLVVASLEQAGFRNLIAEGGQFLLIDVSHLTSNALDLSKMILRDCHVLALPVEGSAGQQYLRITYLQPFDILREGINRLTSYLQNRGDSNPLVESISDPSHTPRG